MVGQELARSRVHTRPLACSEAWAGVRGGRKAAKALEPLQRNGLVRNRGEGGRRTRPEEVSNVVDCHALGLWARGAVELQQARARGNGVPYASLGLRRRCMSRLVLNIGTTFSDTATLVPSRGFCPVRASRRLTRNMPKPRSSARSPRASAVVIVSKMVLTILSTSRWYRCGFCAAIFSISSDLIMGSSLRIR